MLRSPDSASAAPAGRSASLPIAQLAHWVVVAALAIAAGSLFLANLALRTENRSLQSERDLVVMADRMTRNQLAERTLLAETMITELGRRLQRQAELGRLRVATLTAAGTDAGGMTAVVVWDPELQAGLVRVHRLPVVTASHDYQIWFTDPASPDPVRGPVLPVDAAGRAVAEFKPDPPLTTIEEFVITLEPKGGASRPAGPVVLRGR